MAVRQASRQSGGTKARILDAAEDLFIEHGFEAMSMRQITSRAAVNLAAVNYHFGSKEALIHAMLSRRLDQLNEERLRILDRFDAQLGPHVTCEHVLGAMFIPALQASRDPQRGGRAFLRLIGRAYTDPSAFVRNFLTAHYASVAGRFFDAFQRALPNLPRAELGWRLHYAIGALSGALAGAETESLIDEFTQGRTMNDVQMIARLSALIVAALKAPMPDSTQLAIFASVLDGAAASAVATQPAAPRAPAAFAPSAPAAALAPAAFASTPAPSAAPSAPVAPASAAPMPAAAAAPTAPHTDAFADEPIVAAAHETHAT
ncbi:TetR/AcrR family transcriptional regulator [Burkholderia thailandensis]|uniref:Transcriptional regulator, TetR family n=1 Tax=Burkholderia thailandensis (strain ATCC 700388 / DSM 13276 / CCUG 48851 / CIP 106301 / E264) TaxID=271848 RepID=Q2SVK4_BURTA|nr:TetR/AcrR family transcriptional regulator [Burkholderia thailandensis]ABC36986.1 transcriptional regulator, TetR family [Burkholderia thailandensis E264]AHI73513.1 bacterial regulatory s, tetR family protein [Burkholderia thailandensis 2002721723]AHI79886.1 bacterial regulatory s, tetR family protein [Burkholderia thailandensis E444]AIC85966.1 bacterial regulatory s, tetR family protein [Burkholderia thailandensis USAMRU Malaysia \